MAAFSWSTFRQLRQQLRDRWQHWLATAPLRAFQERLHSAREDARSLDIPRLLFILYVAIGALTIGLILMALGGYHSAFYTLNTLGGWLPEGWWQRITFMGDTLFALTVVFLFVWRCPRFVWTGTLAALYGTLFTHAVKRPLGAMRPPAELDPETFHLLGPMLTKHSFPSGHTLTAFTLAATACYFVRDTYLRVLIIAAAILVGLSRVTTGVHWPIDVAAGAFGGCISAIVAVVIARHWHWGLRPGGYHVLVALLTLSAVLLIFHDGGYDQLQGFGVVAGAAALLFVGRDLFRLQRRTGWERN